jgi:hypothetical protein
MSSENLNPIIPDGAPCSPTIPSKKEVIAAFFGMSQGRANEWIHKLSPILESALGAAQALPERNPQNLEQVLALCVSVDFMIDGTERPVQRPTDAGVWEHSDRKPA